MAFPHNRIPRLSQAAPKPDDLRVSPLTACVHLVRSTLFQLDFPNDVLNSVTTAFENPLKLILMSSPNP